MKPDAGEILSPRGLARSVPQFDRLGQAVRGDAVIDLNSLSVVRDFETGGILI